MINDFLDVIIKEVVPYNCSKSVIYQISCAWPPLCNAFQTVFHKFAVCLITSRHSLSNSVFGTVCKTQEVVGQIFKLVEHILPTLNYKKYTFWLSDLWICNYRWDCSILLQPEEAENSWNLLILVIGNSRGGLLPSLFWKTWVVTLDITIESEIVLVLMYF